MTRPLRSPLPDLPPPTPAGAEEPWSPDSWKKRTQAQAVSYPDANALDTAVARLRELPPLVTSWEVERLRTLVADAQTGRRFLLQGGDCAETLADCQPDVIARKLKILLQMSLVLIHGGKQPVIRVGRFAGQYAKPRSNPTRGPRRRLPAKLLRRPGQPAGLHRSRRGCPTPSCSSRGTCTRGSPSTSCAR